MTKHASNVKTDKNQIQVSRWGTVSGERIEGGCTGASVICATS